MTNSLAKRVKGLRQSLLSPAVAALFAGALCLSISAHAFAHAQLEKSRPAPRASLKNAPQTVQLWFNEQLEPAFSIATVVDDKGKIVSSGPAHVDDADPKLLVVPVPVLGPGKYEVRYQVLSVDGHTVESSFRFTVR